MVAQTCVDLALPAPPHFLQSVTDWLGSFWSLVLDRDDAMARLKIAGYELIENAIKYRNGGTIRVRTEIRRWDNGWRLRLTTENSASDTQLDYVRGLLTDLRSAPNPMALYDRMVLETAPRRGVSGLGLARIRAESELALDFRIVGQTLEVVVEATIDLDGGLVPC